MAVELESGANPTKSIRMPRVENARDRVLLPAEETELLQICSPEMKAVIIIALETAMRRGEILSLRREWIKGSVANLPDTKNGTPRKVPLSIRAMKALNDLPARIGGKVFEITQMHCTHQFTKCCKQLGFENLHFHDLRHTATTNLFNKGLSVMEVRAITGHKDLKMLLRYTHINADDLAAKLG